MIGLDINNFRQNHPELIVRDLETFIPADTMRFVLKYRGVNKWLRVRFLLIQLKHRWLAEIKELDIQKQEAKHSGDMKTYHCLAGYREALIDCRQQIRALTHSPRDIDFPESPKERGIACILPQSFPRRPHKRWFWRYDGVREISE